MSSHMWGIPFFMFNNRLRRNFGPTAL